MCETRGMCRTCGTCRTRGICRICATQHVGISVICGRGSNVWNVWNIMCEDFSYV